MAAKPAVTRTSDSSITRTPFRPFRMSIVLACAASMALTGCGTLTGLPAHGGGKRFATEQRLVSASIRAALKDIDVTALKGKRAALIFDLISDEGGGSFNGGRWSPGLLFSVGTMTSPVTTTSNAFQVYNLGESGSSYSNTNSGGGSSSVSTTLQNGSNTNTGTSNTNGSSTNQSSGTNTSSGSTTGSSTNSSTTTGSGTNGSTTTGTSGSTTTGSSTNNSTTTNNGSSSGSSASTTGGTTTTTTNYNQTDNSTNVTAGTGTNTSTTNGTNSSTTNGTSTNTSTTNGTGTNTSTNTSASSSNGSGTNNSQSTTTTTGSNDGSSSTSGGYNTNRQAVSPSPSETVTQTKGMHRDHTATLAYKGLGEYQNFPVPKSDASLLMGLVRTYMMLNGVMPTTPNDPTAEVLVYVTVDIFGTVRSRFDALLYNNETVKAETSFEIMAFDREGKSILRPQVANREAQYREHYLLWTGPLTTKEQVYQGQGLLVDFTDVDGSKGAYNAQAPVTRDFPGGKN